MVYGYLVEIDKEHAASEGTVHISYIWLQDLDKNAHTSISAANCCSKKLAKITFVCNIVKATSYK